MASVSVTHMILFIASIIVAASVAGVLTQEVTRLSDAIDEEGIDVASEIRTDIEIISDAGSDGVYDGTNNVTLLVKNTGSRRLPLDPDQLEVLVDGQYRVNVSLSVVDGESWDVNNVAKVNVTVGALANADHRVYLQINGDEEVFEFSS